MKATRATIVGAVAVLGAIAAGVFHELTKERVVNVRFDLDWDKNVDEDSQSPDADFCQENKTGI